MENFPEKLDELEDSLLNVQEPVSTSNRLGLGLGLGMLSEITRNQMIAGIAVPIVAFLAFYFSGIKMLTVKKNGKRKVSLLRVTIATAIITAISWGIIYYFI